MVRAVSPELTTAELTELFRDCADRAEHLRRAGYHQPTSPDPRQDADLASYGLVTMLPEGPGSGYQALGWRPRLAFAAFAELTTC